MSTFKLPPALLSQHIAIIGKTGSGKTYTAKGMVERLLEEKRRVCILDPTGVWYGLRSSADGKKPGYPVAVFGGDHADVPIAEHSGAALAKIIAGKNLPAIIDLSEMLIGQRHKFVTDFAEAIYADNRAPLHLVIDEADEFCPQNPMPETKRMLHHVDRIVRKGRVRGFRVMLITQRPAVLHKNVLTQANTLVAMRLTAPQDRKAMQAWVEGQADADQAKEVLGSLARLQRGEGWVWAPELDILTRTTFPKITTFDSSRTPEDDEVVIEPSKLATVDLAEVRASFEVVEKELRTMIELKAELAKLRGQLATAERRTSGTGISEAEVQRRIKEAVASSSREPGPSVVDPKVTKALHEIARLATSALGGVATVTVHSPGASTRTMARAVAAAAPAPGPTSEGISGPQQRILDVLAQFETLGVGDMHKASLAAHAGASSKSSSFGNNLGRLRTMGLIAYPSGGYVALTEDGRGKANKPTRALTQQDLHESWLRAVSGPQGAILQALIEKYPGAIERNQLAAMVSASSASSSYGNNLGTLRTLGAITYPERGMVAAAAILFPKGRT